MIRTLNLDSMFIPAGSPEIEFKMLQFSGGEWQIKLNKRIRYQKITKMVITHRFKDMNDLMKVAIAKDALEREGVKNFDLVMPYIPYARQDRVDERGESFTLKVFADLLNSLEFDTVRVIDPHSDVATALINNCAPRSNFPYVRQALWDLPEKAHLIIPDAGAAKKGHKLARDISFISTIQCDKVRDTTTGSLSGFQVHTPSLHGRECLIVDDICDGGGTFMGLAHELKKHGAGQIYLFITHGIFSKGFEELKRYFAKIYCTNSFNTITNDDFITQYPISL